MVPLTVHIEPKNASPFASATEYEIDICYGQETPDYSVNALVLNDENEEREKAVRVSRLDRRNEPETVLRWEPCRMRYPNESYEQSQSLQQGYRNNMLSLARWAMEQEGLIERYGDTLRVVTRWEAEKDEYYPPLKPNDYRDITFAEYTDYLSRDIDLTKPESAPWELLLDIIGKD